MIKEFKHRQSLFHPLCIEGDFITFIDEWRKARTDPSYPLDNLFYMLNPYLIEWRQQLLRAAGVPSISYQTLCERLQHSGFDYETTIESYINTVEKQRPLLDELRYYALIILRRSNVVRGYHLKSWSIAFLYNEIFKLYLYKAIENHANRKLKRSRFYPLPDIELYHEDDIPDWLLINHLDLSNYDWWLLDLCSKEFEPTQAENIFNIPHQTIHKERVKLWIRLKQKYSHLLQINRLPYSVRCLSKTYGKS